MAPAKKTAAKKSTTKKPVKKVAKKASPAKKAPVVKKAPPVVTAPAKSRLNSKYLSLSLVIVGIALLTYKVGPWFVPAIVDNRPVTRFEIWSRMEKSYGAQTLDDVVSEYSLEAAIKQNGISIEESAITTQLESLESQFESVGGLEEALTQRGLTKADLEKQISTQLAVEEILSDKVEPTEEEVQAFFDENAETIFQGQTLPEVKDDVINSVKDGKLQAAFLEWFAVVKEETNVKNFGL
jgi:antitoxin component HigA of HigAB toxin-antitoxin module